MATQLQDCAPAAGIDRADLILNAFDGPGMLTLSEVSRRTGVPRSSAHRMLERLVQLRWVRREGHRYHLGLRLFELGTLAVQQDQLHAAGLPLLRELHRLTGHTVHLAILDGDDVVYLEKLDGGFGSTTTRVGGRRPAASTSVGKVLLANTNRGVESMLAPGRGGAAPTDERRVRQEYAAIRGHGVAFDRGETVSGIGCIGAPVGVKGDVVAAVSICGPVEALPRDSRSVNLVRQTGIGIYKRLSHRNVAI